MKLDRLVIESVEGRIMLGITMFVAIMVLTMWVAINEPARMAAFEEQHLGRSIERGAELFAANCTTCHGTNGYGIAGRAPAINSPQLFGFDYLGEVNGQVARAQRNISDVQVLVDELQDERNALISQVAEADADERATIVEQIAAIDAQIDPETEGSVGAQVAALEEELAPLLEERDLLLADLSDIIELKAYFPRIEEMREMAEAEGNPLIFTNYLTTDASRLAQLGWGGDLRSFLATTLVHGRPGSNTVWPQAMVAWGQSAGGPLRTDQIGDIVNYMLNWDQGDNWTLSDFNRVEQYALIHGIYDTGGGSGAVVLGGSPADVEAALETVAALEGDPVNGEALYSAAAAPADGPVLGCTGCHVGGLQGPALEGTWSRVQNERLTLPEFAGYTVEQYLIESILRPDDYIVDSYSSGVMPGTYGAQLDAQNMADILAYLEAQG